MMDPSTGSNRAAGQQSDVGNGKPGTESDVGEPAEGVDDGQLWDVPRSSPTYAVYTSIASANIGSANFGADARQVRSPAARATGRITESDLADLRKGFVEPPGFVDAAKTIASEHLTFLFGPRGRGKRTSALQLLRKSVDKDIFLLSPRMSGTELAERAYKAGCGYALIDHAGDSGKEGAFSWRLLRDRLTEADARLVITTSVLLPEVPGEFRVSEWRTPDMASVLRERMAVELPDTDIELLDSVLCDVVRVGDTAELARRLTDGEAIEDAVRNLDASAAEAVREWFDRSPSRRRIAEVTTMAFAVDAPVRTYDRMLGGLLRRLHEADPEESATEPEAAMRPLRSGIIEPGGLIVKHTTTTEIGARTDFEFEKPAYHHHVVRALWERYDSEGLWNPVRLWLDDAVDAGDLSIVTGLAALSEVDINEVLEIIDPWSRRERGLVGQFAAMSVLGAMAYQDELAPTALRIATVWICRGDPAQRHTAAAAFSVELGIRYPHDAATRLWQLSVQPHTSAGDVDHALPTLFVSLVTVDSNPSVVLSMLATKMRKLHRPGADIESRARVNALALRVMSVRDRFAGRRSLGRYLALDGARADTVAEVWTRILENRPTRRDSLALFPMVVEDLVNNEENAEGLLRELAQQIGALYTGVRADHFVTDFHRVNLGSRNKSSTKVAALMRIFVAEFSKFARK